VRNGEAVRAVVSVPPRHSKTETILHSIAWLLEQDPRRSIGYVSYADAISRSKSRLARDYARAAGVALRRDAESLQEWRTVANGGLLATGVGGPLTGHGVNVLFVDDPIKNRQEAESSLIRQRTYDWFTSTATTRVEPNGSIVVCHTRWHGDDLIGRLEKSGEGWEVINLPAVSDKGLPLWPSRWPLTALEHRRKAIGEYDWAALFQGRPVPRGGQLFRQPARYETLDVTGARLYIGVDTAASEKTRADYSVAVVLAVRGDGAEMTADVIDVHRVQKEIPALCKDLLALQAKWSAPLAIESVGSGKAVPQVLRSIEPSLQIIEIAGAMMRGDKFTRAQTVAAAWNGLRVRVPVRAPWLSTFLDEVMSFTGVSDLHDDQVDALSHCWNIAAEPRYASGTGDGSFVDW
jgi:predicted phage terminase large subunit-like protein